MTEPEPVSVEVLRAHDHRLSDHERRLVDLETAEQTAASALTGHIQPTDVREDPSWVWSQLDADSLRCAWEDLIVWLTDQAAAHGVSDRLPRDWYRYPALVAHLAAHKAWYEFANQPTAQPREAIDWHDGFYRMVDFVWPRFAGRRETPIARRSAERLESGVTELRRYVDHEVTTRRAYSPQ